jgi:hypothetical protein
LCALAFFFVLYIFLLVKVNLKNKGAKEIGKRIIYKGKSKMGRSKKKKVKFWRNQKLLLNN